MTVRILEGDCREILRTLADSSIDAIVTDPPYHLTTGKKGGSGPASVNLESPYGRARIGSGFMNMTWDGGDVAFQVDTWRECLRVLKPGGHLLAFGGTRTYHRLVCAVEDAGFEIRTQLIWIFGSGFPKSVDVAKAIAKTGADGSAWEGWGTALKPAHEPIVAARKPLIGTVAANVLEHGTGGINVDGCRIPAEAREPITGRGGIPVRNEEYSPRSASEIAPPNDRGRWPATIVHDGSEEVVAIFPSDAGAQAPVHRRGSDKFRHTYGDFAGNIDEEGSTFQGDSGSAARFFYCAKADRADRNVGCADLDEKPLNWSSGTQSPGTFQSPGTKKSAANHHPTVKPVDLMRWLVKLVTPPNGTVLDPFAGSGSTGRAADIEGFDAILIEIDPEYAAIARRRIAGDLPLFAEQAVSA